MKFFTFLIALICFVESTAFPACLSKGLKQEVQIPDKDTPSHCCKFESANCDESKKSTEEKSCDSACSPFLLCGCCMLSFNGLPAMVTSFVFLSKLNRSENDSSVVLDLPSNLLEFLGPPPKFA